MSECKGNQGYPHLFGSFEVDDQPSMWICIYCGEVTELPGTEAGASEAVTEYYYVDME